MSRLGKIPIKFKETTQVSIEKGFIIVKSSNGELKQKLHDLVQVSIENNEVKVDVKNKDAKKEKSFWGLYWSLISNMIKGVEDGFEKKLEVNGVGYKVSIAEQKITLNVGYSHPVDFDLPVGVKGVVEGNVITLSGIDKQLVGEMAAQIRKIRKPEPYKGKGIKYVDEVIGRKEGKTTGKAE